MHLAPDIKISGHIHGRPKCQISLKLPFFILVATTSNFLRCWTLPGTATYGLLCRIQCAAACDRPVGAHMVAYGLFLYGAAAGLLGFIWSHTVPSPMTRRPACGGSYGRIGFFSPMAQRVLTRHAALTNHHHSIIIITDHLRMQPDGCGAVIYIF